MHWHIIIQNTFIALEVLNNYVKGYRVEHLTHSQGNKELI